MTALIGGYVLLGILAGLYGSVIGLGGGVIIVPALLLLYRMDPHTTVAVSLCAVFANSVSGTVAYARQGRVDFRSGLLFAPALVPGSIAGAFIVSHVPLRPFSAIFGALFFAVSLFLLANPSPAPATARQRNGPGLARRIIDARGHRFVYRVNVRLGQAVSALAGFISSLLGIGGGVLHVPAMILLLGFPNHIAVATSTFIIALTSAVGASAFALQGAVNWTAAAAVAVGAIAGAQAGARVSRSLTGAWIGRLLALALAGIGLRMLALSALGR